MNDAFERVDSDESIRKVPLSGKASGDDQILRPCLTSILSLDVPSIFLRVEFCTDDDAVERTILFDM